MNANAVRFAVANVAGLVVSALLLLWLSRDGSADMWLTSLFFDPVLKQFPLKDVSWFAQVGHTGLKWLVVALWLALATFTIAAARIQMLRRWRAPCVTTLASATVAVVFVALLKINSPHSCPWDLATYGGNAEWFALLDTITAQAGPGRCWPGGHASGGFALLAGYFSFRDRHPWPARSALVAALVLGGMMSAVQVARGAHFLSHNLWTLWIVWLVCLLGDLVSRNVKSLKIP